jgi:hypothetical protein
MVNVKIKRNLEALSILVGDWEMTTSRWPEGLGHTTFDWVEDGAFLRFCSREEHGGFPASTALIGPDDATEDCCMLYHDDRGVCRAYRLTVKDGVLKIWRDAPEFSQRFTGKIKDGGKTIEGQWEFSRDGSRWEMDFDLAYRKVT